MKTTLEISLTMQPWLNRIISIEIDGYDKEDLGTPFRSIINSISTFTMQDQSAEASRLR